MKILGILLIYISLTYLVISIVILVFLYYTKKKSQKSNFEISDHIKHIQKYYESQEGLIKYLKRKKTFFSIITSTKYNPIDRQVIISSNIPNNIVFLIIVLHEFAHSIQYNTKYKKTVIFLKNINIYFLYKLLFLPITITLIFSPILCGFHYNIIFKLLFIIISIIIESWYTLFYFKIVFMIEVNANSLVNEYILTKKIFYGDDYKVVKKVFLVNELVSLLGFIFTALMHIIFILLIVCQ